MKPTYEELERKLEASEAALAKALARERAMENRMDLFNGILSVSPVGIGLFDDRRFQWVNAAMRRMFGFRDESDYLGKSSRLLYDSDAEFARIGTMYNNLKAGEIVKLEVRCRRMDGSAFWGHVEISCPDPTRPTKRVILTIFDISAQKQAEAELKEREKLKGTIEMAGAVCHQLNQPLQALFVYTELLLRDLTEDNLTRKSALNIKDQIARISRITEKLMGITRYETTQYYGDSKIIDIDKSST